ncbi:hypothetical protein N7491_011232 [Penicillium cf. griseofulvum]|uniref:Uncharacterized protein n=1 Tax=Penicillium cf. griseofulvum TaxID=2972120 RepID=A0A9W9T6R8_9EURO|nr:hypothetical protein N7472_001553 [Penicillium cf. griseofulvum]KAJ5422787.1 hypothetical protein N7491_011232 [Penicillium cf. griseofulvum]
MARMALKPDERYKSFVKFRQQTNPCIGELLKFLDAPWSASSYRSCRSYTASYNVNNTERPPMEFEEIDIIDISSVLTAPQPGHIRLIIIEDIHPSIVEILGAELDIDPIFFADYIVTNYGGIETTPAPPSVALAPSQVVLQNNRFHLHSQKVIDLGCAEMFRGCAKKFATSANVPRSVRRLVPLSGRQLGILRGCSSFFVKSFDQSWIVDSTTPDILEPSATTFHSERTRFRCTPLHNGFEDFRNPVSFSQLDSSKPITGVLGLSGSHLEVLVNCFSSGDMTLNSAGPSVLNLAYYSMRINISEWMLYIQVMARYLSYYEYSLRNINSAIDGERGDMIDLQKWRHRSLQSQLKLRSARHFVHYWLAQGHNSNSGDIWPLIVKDFDLLISQIEQYGQSLERIIPIVTSMVQLSDAQRSISESVNVRRLTYVALVFIPLSWVAAIFSMADGYAPGQSKFWVYFVIAVPLCMATIYGSYLTSMPNIRWFNKIVHN